MHAYGPRNQEVEARGSGVQAASAIHRHFETSLGYRKLSQKTKVNKYPNFQFVHMQCHIEMSDVPVA